MALLRLDRADEAPRQARELRALDDTDPRSRLFARAAEIYQRESRVPFPAPEAADTMPPDALINQLPLLSSRYSRMLADMAIGIEAARACCLQTA